MSQLFTVVLLQPILNALVWLYNVVPGQDIGIAIILITILIKLILYPLTAAQLKQQRALQSLQPKIDEIRQKYKDDKEAQGKELMALYGREKVNPASSCLPLIVQLPVFLALYRALSIGLHSTNLDLLYSFVAHPQQINPKFLGILDLTHPSYVLAILAAAVQYWQTRQMLKVTSGAVTPPPPEVDGTKGAQDESMAAIMNKQMMYVMPILTAVIGFSLPGGLALYWLTMSLLTYFQQLLLTKTPKPLDGSASMS